MQLRREQGRGRHGQEREETADVLRRLEDELLVRLHDLGRLLDGPERGAGAHRRYGMQAEQKGRDDAEIAHAAAHCPEQVDVLGQRNVHFCREGEWLRTGVMLTPERL